MVSMLRWEYPSPNRMSELHVYIFFYGLATLNLFLSGFISSLPQLAWEKKAMLLLLLQALNSDVATIICQCCDRPSDEKIMIGCPSGSSTAFDMES